MCNIVLIWDFYYKINSYNSLDLQNLYNIDFLIKHLNLTNDSFASYRIDPRTL